MKRSAKKFLAAALMTALLFQASPTHAEPIAATQQQIEAIEDKIQIIDNKIIESIVKLENLHKKIQESEERVEAAQQEIAVAEEEYKSSVDISSDRLRSMQRSESNRFIEYLDILLSSNGIGDFIQRTKALSIIMDSDKKLIESLAEKESNLREKEDALSEELDSLKEKKQQAEVEKQTIETEKARVQQELRAAEQILEQLQREEAQRQEEARLAAERQAQQVHMSANTNTNTVTSVSRSANVLQQVEHVEYDSEIVTKLIAEAKRHLGTPYLWGGTTPNGFDCSGFTQYVFRSVGINLPRVTTGQQQVGTPVSLHQLQPGDLIFRGNPSHHVGIYIGNNQYIHSPRTGDVVKIVPYSPSKFTFARRVLN